MAKPRSLVLSAICLKTSDKSHVPSMVKLGECFLKYSFLATLTRLVSQLIASEWLCLSILYQGGTSHPLELGGPSVVALNVVPPRGMLSTGVWGSVQAWVQEELLKQMVAQQGKPLVIRRMDETWVVCPNNM